MEVDDLNQSADAVDTHATEDDLLFAEDGVDAAEYTTGEVDQLLGDDEDAEKYYAEEGADVEGVEAAATHEEEGGEVEEHEGEGEEEEEEEEEEGGEEAESSYGYRGRGMRRPFFRGMRGGRFMMRGMMMMGPPRFFPPMHPGMRPPFPPFMGPGRPPFGMRGMRPMRLPMPIPPHFMRMPGVYHRYGGPTATRGRGGSNESRPAITSESGDTPTTTKSDGPQPLMSIPTPAPLKAMVFAQRGRGMIGMGMGPRYHGMQSRGGSTPATSSYRGSSSASASHPRMPLKRPATSNGAQPMHIDHSEPQSKMSKPRNTLTYIRTVDEPMHSTPSTTTSSYYNRPQPHQQHQPQQQYPKPTHTRGGYSHTTSGSSHYITPTASHYTSATSHYTPAATHYTTQTQYAPPATHYPAPQSNSGYQPRPAYTPVAAAPARFVVSHKPAPNLTQIPLTPSDSSQGPAANIRPVPAVRGVKVMIWNLPGSANFAEVSSMTTSCGSVRTLNVRKENNTAIIEFSNPQSADHFIRLHHNTIMDNCVLTVNRI